MAVCTSVARCVRKQDVCTALCANDMCQYSVCCMTTTQQPQEQFNESMGAVMMDADPDVMAAAHCIADECKRASIRMAVVARDTQAALFEAEDHAREAAEVGLLPVTAKEESDTHGPHHAVPAKPRGGQAGHVDGKCGKGSKGVVVGKMHGASKGGVHTRTRCA